MKLKITIAVLLVVIVGAIFLLKSNNNGGEVMAAAESTTKVNSGKKVLVAYFSRTGEQYNVGNIKEGNTAIIGKMIASKTGGDIFEIKVVKDEYPEDHMKMIEYAKQEKNNNKRPAIIGKVNNFADYDVIFIGYPNWWADLPMPVYTFLESYDFKGKTVIPFCTHEGSGLSGTERNVKATTKADVKEGLAIYGHVAQNSRKEADKKVSDWLKDLGF